MIQTQPTIHVDLADRLRVTAGRLSSMPVDLATSLSITTNRQGRSDADIRAVALSIARPLGFTSVVETDGDAVTVTFARADRRHR